ncbi:MAG: threonine synthase [Flavobacteriaceae bacterium]|nr:threonine synthase [Flavobacteriaceae bacterium]
MNYFSLHHKSPKTSFKNAVVNGIAPDKGLYFPETITPLSKDFIENIDTFSNKEIAFEVIKQFVGNEIPEKKLKEIITETISFDFPVVPITNNIGVLELFHGPTMAFKDVGAKFMANCLAYFNENNEEEITVLVATSGDTGGAVANGFLGAKGVNVVILYPSGKVSDIQEKQLTTLGQNITAFEVNGTFDDCQEMVKTAFLDTTIPKKLTSANSINVARWLPQMFYFFFAYKQLHKKQKELIFSVPSGNFGNICAGMLAQKLGLPIKHFIAATNVNDTIPNFMLNGIYTPKQSIATISNAMDVGNPSNFIRILELFNNNFDALKNIFSSFSFTDDVTKIQMKKINVNFDYIAEPHGAIGFAGLMKYKLKDNEYGVFLETAHPVKFKDVVEKTLNVKVEIPTQIKKVINKEKVATKITTYQDLKEFLIQN